MILKVDNLNQQAYDILKEKILKKELAPGERLVDSQLAEEFGISRTPLRDAIRKLSEEGFVVCSDAKKGYYVYQPSARDINEIFELRLMIDITAAAKLITDVLPNNPAAFQELEASYVRGSSGEPESFVRGDEDFHDTIIRLCGNLRMQAIYTDLRNQTRAFRSVTSRDPQRMGKANDFHERIYKGLCALDLDMTLAAIRQHVAFSRQDALADYIKDEA